MGLFSRKKIVKLNYVGKDMEPEKKMDGCMYFLSNLIPFGYNLDLEHVDNNPLQTVIKFKEGGSVGMSDLGLLVHIEIKDTSLTSEQVKIAAHKAEETLKEKGLTPSIENTTTYFQFID